ncbi:MAG: TIGR04283 family arsenosugar biosynthesis glycosyltransferase [Actinomycetota bacterium]|nr:TIGR04283 family arsenosugar biosynthesis glycosyltransferase [Actinomycetota bacterium]
MTAARNGTAMLISVVVPVLDEAATVGSLLDHLAGLEGRLEVILADGGSTDATVQVACEHAPAPRMIRSERGRARQMNEGAAVARGEAIIFLHADTRLPPQAYRLISTALADPRVIGGNFSLRFDGEDQFSRLLGLWYRAQRRAGIYYGDSAVWLRRDTFEQLDGFRALPIMEDYDLVRRLERAGRTVCLPGPAITSARRWQRLGLARTIASWVLIRWLYLAGVSPVRLARLYPRVR